MNGKCNDLETKIQKTYKKAHTKNKQKRKILQQQQQHQQQF